MAGTIEGGKKAAARNLAKDPDFYRRIGAKGGRNGNTGGFAAGVICKCDLIEFTHFIQNCAGKKGGAKSRRKSKRTSTW